MGFSRKCMWVKTEAPVLAPASQLGEAGLGSQDKAGNHCGGVAGATAGRSTTQDWEKGSKKIKGWPAGHWCCQRRGTCCKATKSARRDQNRATAKRAEDATMAGG